MDISHLFMSAIILPGFFQVAHAAGSEEFHLGGARDAKVHIKLADEKLICDVSFFPVKAFSASKNRELNLSKARLYCLRALVIRTGAATGQEVEVDGLTITGVGRINGIRYSQIFELPLDNIRVAGSDVTKKADLKIEFKSGADTKAKLKLDQSHGLLSRASDHKDMIDQIALDLSTGMNACQEPDLDVWVADKEEEIFSLFESCLKEVLSDKLLLKIEKEHLVVYISEKRFALFNTLSSKFNNLSF